VANSWLVCTGVLKPVLKPVLKLVLKLAWYVLKLVLNPLSPNSYRPEAGVTVILYTYNT
jgi:hypothetical protein